MNDKKIDRLMAYARVLEAQAGKAVRPYRADGFMNLLNRYGTSKDSSERYVFVPEVAVADESLANFYEGNGLFAKIIDAPAEEALKHGFELEGISDEKVESFYQEALDELDWEETAMTAIKWARLFGGSIAVLLVNDGRGLEEPLDWRNIKSIDDIRVYDRSVINPDYQSMYQYSPDDPFRTRGSRLGMPERFSVFSKYGTFEVHESRCLVFQNGTLPEKSSNSIYQFWGMPEYVRIHRAIQDAEIAHRSAPKMLDKSIQPVYKMKNLSSTLATEEGENMVLKRLQTIDLARGMMNSIVVDNEGEDYDFRTFQFNGVADVIDSACNYLSALTNIPQTILFGRSPAGMNSTGTSDLENWYNYVQRIQKRMLRSNLRYLLSVIFQAGVATGEIDEVPPIKVNFSPLWSLSDLEQAELEQKKANTAQIKATTTQMYVDMQAIDPSEVRKSLADSKEYDVETLLDEYEGDEEALMAMYEEVEDPGRLAQEGDFSEYATGVDLEEHNVDPGTEGSTPANAPAATKLPQDMSEQEKIQSQAAQEAAQSQNTTDNKQPTEDAKPGSVGVIVVSDGRVLCGTRHNDFGYGLICGPGGHIEKGETPEEAAIRETQEEFGITPKDLVLVGEGPAEPDTGLTPYIFVCTEYEGEVDCLDLEMTAPKFRELSEIEDLEASLFQPFRDGLTLLLASMNEERADGGEGSGNWGHEGVPGKVGGSAPGTGGAEHRLGSKASGYTSAAKEREKAKKGIREAEGSNIVGKYTGDKQTKSVLKAQGFTGLGTVANKEDFKAAVEASGFIAQRTYSASSQEVLDAYRDELYYGDFYVDCTVGGAQYGQGMYCAANWEGELTDGIVDEMTHYQVLGATRATQDAMRVYASTLTKEDFKDNFYSRNLDLTDDEIRVFSTLKSNPNMTGFKLPDEDRKIWMDMMNNGKMSGMNLAYSDMEYEFAKSFEAPSFTETITLAPGAKVITYSDLVLKQQNAGKEWLDSELTRYAGANGPEVEAFYRIQTGAGATKADYDIVKRWLVESPDAYNAAEDFRVNAANRSQQITVDALNTDPGAYAAMLGYDAINAKGHGASGSYTVILNRTKTIFLDPSERYDANGGKPIKFVEDENGVICAMRDGVIIGWVYTSDGSGINGGPHNDGGPGSGNRNRQGGPGSVGGSTPTGKSVGDKAKTAFASGDEDEVASAGNRVISGFSDEMIFAEKSLDFSADEATIKPKSTNEDGGPGSGRYPKGSGNSKFSNSAYNKALLGMKTSDGKRVESIDPHLYKQAKVRDIHPKSVADALKYGKTTPGNISGRTVYSYRGTTVVFVDDIKQVKTAIYKGKSEKKGGK